MAICELIYLQLDKGIRAAVVVHGQQIDALLHVDNQRPPLRIVAQRDEHLAIWPALRQLRLVAILILHTQRHGDPVLRCAMHLQIVSTVTHR